MWMIKLKGISPQKVTHFNNNSATENKVVSSLCNALDFEPQRISLSGEEPSKWTEKKTACCYDIVNTILAESPFNYSNPQLFGSIFCYSSSLKNDHRLDVTTSEALDAFYYYIIILELLYFPCCMPIVLVL